MSWMLAVSPWEVLPLKSPIGRGASIACDECSVVFVRRFQATVIFPSVAEAIAAATTFCEGWTYEPAPGDRTDVQGRLTCYDCIATQEACALVEVLPIRHDVIPSTVVRRRDECDKAGS